MWMNSSGRLRSFTMSLAWGSSGWIRRFAYWKRMNRLILIPLPVSSTSIWRILSAMSARSRSWWRIRKPLSAAGRRIMSCSTGMPGRGSPPALRPSLTGITIRDCGLSRCTSTSLRHCPMCLSRWRTGITSLLSIWMIYPLRNRNWNISI